MSLRPHEGEDTPLSFAALAPLLRAGGAISGPDARWVATPRVRWSGATLPIRLASTASSNTALVLGESALFKFFRRLEPGLHPELELGRLLTARRFAHAPPLLAELHVETAAGRAAAGVLHTFLPGRVDGWTFATRHARADMSLEAHALGAVTRELHELLATAEGPLASRPVDTADRAHWASSLRELAGAALTRLAAAQDPLLRARHAELAAALTPRLIAAIDVLSAAEGPLIPVHGDYHLGQVLFEPSSRTWSIVDLEGEPTRPLAERLRPQHPLRDLAGMLRSFAYAALVGGGGPAWEASARAAFLDGYDARAPPGSPLPRAASSPLLGALLFSRALYELTYELDYRPQHAWIPLAALVDGRSAAR